MNMRLSLAHATCSLAFLLTAVAEVGSVCGQDTGANDLTPRIVYKSVPLTAAIENLARQAGITYMISPKLFGPGGRFASEPSVNLNLTNTTAKEALEIVLKEHQLFLVEDPVTTVARIADTNRLVSTVDPQWVAADTNKPTHVELWHVPLDEGLRIVVSRGNIEVSLDPSLSRRVGPTGIPAQLPVINIRWDKITPRQALAALLDNYDLVMVRDPSTGVLRITTKELPALKSAPNTNPNAGGANKQAVQQP